MKPGTPFEIAREGDVHVASNGDMTLSIFAEEGGRLFKRRAVAVHAGQPVGESLVRKLNQLSEALLKNPETPAEAIQEQLLLLASTVGADGAVQIPKAEWAVAELNGVRAYVDGKNVILTSRDLNP